MNNNSSSLCTSTGKIKIRDPNIFFSSVAINTLQVIKYTPYSGVYATNEKIQA